MIDTRRGRHLLLTSIAIVNFGLHPSHTLASPLADRAKPVARHSVSQAPLVGTYDKLPLSFEANKGQIDPSVKFLSRGKGYSLFLTRDEAVLHLRKLIPKASGEDQGTETNNKGKSADNALVHIRLVGANTSARVTGVDELPGKTNYFIGNDPKKWRTNVPTYAKVRYNAIYPGVDLVYYGNQGGQVESDFVVRPGADPKAITFNVGTDLVRGARDNKAPIRLDENGDLILQAGGGDVRFQKPVIYQHDGHGLMVNVDGHYLLKTEASEISSQESRISFEVASYDRSKPLVIDPVIAYSTFLGGATESTSANAIAVFTDPVTSKVYAYVAGGTCASDFPTVNALQNTIGLFGNYGNSCDVFVTKFDPSASGAASVIYSTFLGGTGLELANGIVVDAAGNAYLAGQTSSTDFPTMNAFETNSPGSFLAKLSEDGSTLMYSTYFEADAANAIALDTFGRAYIAGYMSSPGLPTVNPYQGSFVNVGRTFCITPGDAFVAGFDTSKSGPASLIYSTYLGAATVAHALAVDALGAIHVGGEYCGNNKPSDFPLMNGFQSSVSTAGVGAAIYAKLNPNASGLAQLVYSTYLGGGDPYSGSDRDMVQGIAVDSVGNAYLTGSTLSGTWPTTPGTVQSTRLPAAYSSTFTTKIDPSKAGSASLVYSTLIPNLLGSGSGAGIAIDATGDAFVVGNSGPGIPLVNPVLGSANGVIQSINGGDSWTSLTQGLTEFPIDALVIDVSTSPRALYAGTSNGSIFSTADGGLNWNRVFQAPSSNAQQCGRVFFNTTGTCIMSLAVDPTTPSNVYAGTNAGVYKSADRGATWSSFNTGLSSGAVQGGVLGLTFDGGTLYSGTNDGLFVLEPGATSWIRTTLAVDVRNVTIDPATTPHTIYTASEQVGAYKSADSGLTWTNVGAILGGSISTSFIAVDTGTSPSTLYAIDFYAVEKSTDGGQTWTGLSLSIPTPDLAPFMSIAVDTATIPSTLYVEGDAGISKSLDSGNTWASIVDASLGGIALDPATRSVTTPATLYAATLSANGNAFVVELNPTGSALLFSTYLGGIGSNSGGSAVALDALDNIYVAGANDPSPTPYSFTTLNAYQATPAGSRWAFFTKLGSQTLPMTSSGSVSSQVGVQTGTLTVNLPNITGSTTSTAPTLTVTPLSSTTTVNFSLSDNLGAYDISTTALYSGAITLCFQALTVNDLSTFNNLQLVHIVNGAPVNVTTTRTFSTRTVCGSVTSLSPVVLISGTPRVTWNNPADIIYGTTLSSTQLNAASNVQGSFTYTTAAGAVLNPGAGQPLSVRFTPTNTSLYSIVTKTVTINVLYATTACNGDLGHAILQPINTDGTSVFKLGSTVPTKFRVCDANGISVGLPGTVVSYQLIGAGSATGLAVDEQVYSTASDTTFRWDSIAKQWIFNQSTKNNSTLSQTNTIYVFRINLKDGTSIQFRYGLK